MIKKAFSGTGALIRVPPLASQRIEGSLIYFKLRVRVIITEVFEQGVFHDPEPNQSPGNCCGIAVSAAWRELDYQSRTGWRNSLWAKCHREHQSRCERSV